jgi:hypothetical protein
MPRARYNFQVSHDKIGPRSPLRYISILVASSIWHTLGTNNFQDCTATHTLPLRFQLSDHAPIGLEFTACIQLSYVLRTPRGRILGAVPLRSIDARWTASLTDQKRRVPPCVIYVRDQGVESGVVYASKNIEQQLLFGRVPTVPPL